MFEIIPVTCTQVDWSRFVSGTNRLINRSPTRELDNASVQPGLPQHFIPALGEFACKGTTPTQAMKHGELILKHMMFGFLVACPHPLTFQIVTSGHNLDVLMTEPSRGKENFIISGNLATWKSAIINGCSDHAEPESREFYNAMWTFFNSFGLGEIFASHRRKDLKDTTWALEQKR